MRYQAIQYDPATGRIRQVLDPERDMAPEDVVKLLSPEPHEAVFAYAKQVGQNRLHEWQCAISLKHGVYPAEIHPAIEDYILRAAKLAGLSLRKV